MKNIWIFYGFGAAISFGCMMLTYKKLLLMNLQPLVLNFFVFGLTFIGFSAWVSISNTPIKISTPMLLFLLLASCFAIMGNYFDVNAVKAAPNPGYSTTLKATQIVIVTLLAPIIFDSHFNLQKLFGVFLVLSGVFLVSR